MSRPLYNAYQRTPHTETPTPRAGMTRDRERTDALALWGRRINRMLDFFFANTAAWFGVPAVIGTGFFVLRLVIMLTVGIADVDADVAAPDADAALDPHHADSTEAFKVISIQAITAFLMGFGWAGLGALKGTDWGLGASIAVAILGGALMMWILAMLLKAVYTLQSSGNISIREAVGKSGDVYASIPPKGQGRGKVRVIVKGSPRIYNAVAESTEPFATGARVRVRRVGDDRTLIVEAEA